MFNLIGVCVNIPIIKVLHIVFYTHNASSNNKCIRQDQIDYFILPWYDKYANTTILYPSGKKGCTSEAM